jgi:hypothetical protein
MATLSDTDVILLALNDSEAARRVAELARATARGTFGRLGGSVPMDTQEWIAAALYDAFVAIQTGVARDGETLTTVVRRSVWREAKRAQRLRDREISVDFEEEEIDLLLGKVIPADQEAGIAQRDAERILLSDPVLLHRDLKSAEGEARTRLDLLTVDDELIRYLTKHPEHMYDVSPRRFEELVAAILRDIGYTVELTGLGADGGVDIVAIQNSAVGESLLLVDCKRYAARRPVGVSIVRAMFGITEQRRATMGLIATTSSFTQPALEFQETVKHRLTLRDYHGLLQWLQSFGRRPSLS